MKITVNMFVNVRHGDKGILSKNGHTNFSAGRMHLGYVWCKKPNNRNANSNFLIFTFHDYKLMWNCKFIHPNGPWMDGYESLKNQYWSDLIMKIPS